VSVPASPSSSLSASEGLFSAIFVPFFRVKLRKNGQIGLVVEKSPLSECAAEWEDRGHVPAT
jgi:hypothetical protein